jgi:hypothetical protein
MGMIQLNLNSPLIELVLEGVLLSFFFDSSSFLGADIPFQ